MDVSILKDKKILVVDNQIRELEAVRGKLEKPYQCSIFPSKDDYKKVTDWVRIALNRRYEYDKKTDAEKLLLNYIIDTKPDLFIIDFKLSGCHDGHTGIELAIMLRARENFPETPVMFLTRAASNDEAVIDKKSSFESSDPTAKHTSEWVNKGYAGMQLTTDHYFTKHVLTKIIKLLKETWFEHYKAKVEDLKIHPQYVKHEGMLNGMLAHAQANGKVDPVHKEVIEDLYDQRTRDQGEIDRLLNSIKLSDYRFVLTKFVIL